MDHFFATEFYPYFSENPPNVTSNVISSTQKMLQKVMKITRFELLRGPFIYRNQASRRKSKIMQNDAKMHYESPRNDHKNFRFPSHNAQKRTPSTDLQNYMKTRSLLSYRCCFAYAMDAKSFQIIEILP